MRHPNGFRIRSWLFSCLVLWVAPAQAVPAGALPPDDWREEATKGWAELRAKCLELNWRGKETHINSGTSKDQGETFDNRISNISFLRNGNEFFLININEIERFNSKARPGDIVVSPGNQTSIGMNSSYVFEVVRPQAGRPFTLRHRAFGEKVVPHAIMFRLSSYVDFMVSIRSKEDLAEMVAAPGFHVQAVEDVTEAGGKYVRVRFTKEANKENVGVKSGWLMLDPKCHWIVKESDVLWTNGQKFHKVCEYDVDEMGFPALKKTSLTMEASRGNESSLHRYSIDFSEWKYTRPDKKEFYLPRFDLPE